MGKYKTWELTPLLEQSVFRKALVENAEMPELERVRDTLPQPYWPARPQAIDAYWRAWEIAFSNLRPAGPDSGNIHPYLDSAFNGNLFMWDSVFSLFFARYGRNAFPFQKTLDNFYARQHDDGFICRELQPDGEDAFERQDPSSTGPNILAWSEWEYYLHTADPERLKSVFHALLAYHRWVRKWRTWPDGTYFSSGWGCGMDNQPRLEEQYNQWWDHGHLSWVDTTLQALLSAKTVLRMAEELDLEEEAEDLVREIPTLEHVLLNRFWDPATAFFYDLTRDGRKTGVRSIGAYWSLLAGVAGSVDLPRFLSHLDNTGEFHRTHLVPSLSASDPDYSSSGSYWRGSVWPSTNYMVIRGLSEIGRENLAQTVAMNHLENVLAVFEETGTFWENYAPDAVCPGNQAKDEFVGWTGIPPIALLLEYAFGIRPDPIRNRLVWHIHHGEEFGVTNYPFGSGGTIDLHCDARANLKARPKIDVRSEQTLTVEVHWNAGHDVITVAPRSRVSV